MLLQLLNKEDLKEINDIKNSLLNYNEYIKLFMKDFEEKRRNSIFEFSIISLVIMERENFQILKKKDKNVQIELIEYYIMELVLSLYLVY
jgi:hypothetical protein